MISDDDINKEYQRIQQRLVTKKEVERVMNAASETYLELHDGKKQVSVEVPRSLIPVFCGMIISEWDKNNPPPTWRK